MENSNVWKDWLWNELNIPICYIDSLNQKLSLSLSGTEDFMHQS